MAIFGLCCHTHVKFFLASLSPHLFFTPRLFFPWRLSLHIFPHLKLNGAVGSKTWHVQLRACRRWYVVQFRFVSFLFQPPPSFQLAPNARQRGKLQLGMFVRFSLEIAIFGLCCPTHFNFFAASLTSPFFHSSPLLPLASLPLHIFPHSQSNDAVGFKTWHAQLRACRCWYVIYFCFLSFLFQSSRFCPLSPNLDPDLGFGFEQCL